MSLFNTLRITMTVLFPYAIAEGAGSLISFKRIQKFLLLEEQARTYFLDASNFRPKLAQCGLWLNKINASWNSEGDTTLQNVTLTVKPGELLVIVGPVGCGKDIDQFPYGDRTIVGEKGMRLSGGQKARVNLARAVYSNADIFLLDDPLSSVDTTVCKHLFYKCINGCLKDKICILATHEMQFLKKASQILVLKKGGCLALGTYHELIDAGIDLRFLIKENEKEQKQGLTCTTGMNNMSAEEEILDSITETSVITTKLSESSTVERKYEDNDKKQQSIIQVPAPTEEQKATGTVKFKIYKDYVKSGAGPLLTFTVLLSCIATQVVFTGSDFWLTEWTTLEQRKYNTKDCWIGVNKTILNETGFYNYTYGVYYPSIVREMFVNVSDDCFYLTQNYVQDVNDVSQAVDTKFRLSVYAGMILLALFLSLQRSILFFQMCIRSSINLHNKMFKSVLRSPIAFFESNPVGRILNRFSKDTGVIDEAMPLAALDVMTIFSTFVGVVCVVATIEPYLLLPTSVISTMIVFLRRCYIPTARDVKRYEGITSSPLFSHISNSFCGLTTIRAFKAQRPFKISFDHYQDQHTGTWFMYICLTRWLAVALDSLCVVYIICITATMVTLSKDPSFASKAGLAIVSALQLATGFEYCVRRSAELESQMTSVERVIEYNKLKSEAALDSEQKKKPPNDWPSKGHIVYQNISLKYSPNEPPVLKNINFEIFPKEKVGIVGRTGAGKSSVMATLFRMIEPEGTINVDGVCTSDIGLHDLRTKISIIPQDPILFTGTVRRNLDPFSEYNDNELWQALEEAYLKDTIKDLPRGLDTEVSERGANFSMGERQLMCLARAILRRNKILVLDEATANVDPKTDNLIQRTIRDRFKHCTVLTIAHRLNTIMNSNRVLVLDEGEVKEFDEPYVLLKKANGLFFSMVQMTEPGMAKELRHVAHTAYMKRRGSDKGDNNVFGGPGGDDVIDMNGSFTVRQNITNDVEFTVPDGHVNNAYDCT